MRIQRTYLIIILFICIEVALGLYILNYTSRVKKPVWSYQSDEEITCISISSSGKSFSIGTANGSIIFFLRGRSQPEWVYHGRYPIVSLALSADGDYLFAIEGDDTVLVFSDTPLQMNGVITPRWTYRSPISEIGGVHSSRTIPPSIYYIVISNSDIHFISNGENLIWKFHSGARDIVSALSSNGLWVAVGDSKGDVYLLTFRSSEPLWKVSTELIINSVAISLDNKYIAVGGATKLGEGEIYLLTLKEGKIVWNQRFDQPIDMVLISHDGSRVFTDWGDGSATIILYDGSSVERRTLRMGRGIDSITSPPVGSYIISSNPEGDVYLFYIHRSAPLWKFSIDGESPLIATTLTGEHVLIAGSRHLNLLSNIYSDEMISGSRIGWSVVFFIGFSGMAVLAVLWGESPRLLGFKGSDSMILLMGLSLGTVIGLFVFEDLSEAFIIGGLGSALSCYFCWKREGLLNFLAGCYLGILSSLTSGCFLGLLYWFGGDERNLITLMILFAAYGLKGWLICGPFGAIIGSLSARAFNIAKLHKN